MVVIEWLDGQRDGGFLKEDLDDSLLVDSWEVRIERLEAKVRELERKCFQTS